MLPFNKLITEDHPECNSYVIQLLGLIDTLYSFHDLTINYELFDYEGHGQKPDDDPYEYDEDAYVDPYTTVRVTENNKLLIEFHITRVMARAYIYDEAQVNECAVEFGIENPYGAYPSVRLKPLLSSLLTMQRTLSHH